MELKSKYLTQFSNRLYDYCKINYLCDVKISIGDEYFTAHSLVLSTVSPKLKSFFEKFNSKQSKTFNTNNTFKLLADDCSITCLEYVLQYIYTGSVDILPSNSNQKDIGEGKQLGSFSYSELMKVTQKLGINDNIFLKNMTFAFTNGFLLNSKMQVDDIKLNASSGNNINEDHNYTNWHRNIKDDIIQDRFNAYNPSDHHNEINIGNYDNICTNENNDNIHVEDIVHVSVISNSGMIQPLVTKNSSKTQLKRFLTNKHLDNSLKKNNNNDNDNDNNNGDELENDKTNVDINNDYERSLYNKSSLQISKSNIAFKNSSNSRKDSHPNSKLKSLLQAVADSNASVPNIFPVKNPTAKKPKVDEMIPLHSLRGIILDKTKTENLKTTNFLTGQTTPENVKTAKKVTLLKPALIKASLSSSGGALNVGPKVKINFENDKSNPDALMVCDTCGLPFTSSKEYTLHKREHANSKRYACDICHKTFSRSYAVREHKRLHNGERPFQCDRCGKRFTFASDLTKHRRSLHGTVKPYSCAECGKEMSTGREVADHKRLHQGGNTCPECGKTFTRLHNMKEHIRGTHEGFKSFCCPHCDKKFVYSNSLRLHKRRHKLTATVAGESTTKAVTSETDSEKGSKCKTADGVKDSKNLILDAVETVNCGLCGVVFKRQLDLIIHDKVHHAFNVKTAPKTASYTDVNTVSSCPKPSETVEISKSGCLFSSGGNLNVKIVQLPTDPPIPDVIVGNSNILHGGVIKSPLTIPMYVLFNQLPEITENSISNENITTGNLNILSSPLQSINNAGGGDTLQELSFSDLINLGN